MSPLAIHLKRLRHLPRRQQRERFLLLVAQRRGVGQRTAVRRAVHLLQQRAALAEPLWAVGELHGLDAEVGAVGVLADLPGVAQEALDVRVEQHVLTIRGQVRHGAPAEVVSREYDLVNFFRQVALREHVDQRQITAALKSGVLTVTLPKAEAAKPRQIAVHAA